MSRKKKKDLPPSEDAGFVVKRSKFSDRSALAAISQLMDTVKDLGTRMLQLPQIKGKTQHEEMIRSLVFARHKYDVASLPYFTDGTGAKEKSIFRCLSSELSCLIVAVWKFRDNMTMPNAESVQDHVEYINNLLYDPSTIRVDELKNCRYRAVNSRIDAGERLNEAVE